MSNSNTLWGSAFSYGNKALVLLKSDLRSTFRRDPITKLMDGFRITEPTPLPIPITFEFGSRGRGEWLCYLETILQVVD